MSDPEQTKKSGWHPLRRLRTFLRPKKPPKPGTFLHVGGAFWERALRPINQVNHWVYILVGVVFLGGLGTLVEYYSLFAYDACITALDWHRCAKTLTSYALAVAGTAAVQMVLYEEGDSQLRAPAVALLSFVVLLSIPVLTNGATSPKGAHVLAILATILALLLCWLAAANHTPTTDASASMGGPLPAPNRPVSLPGRAPNFKV